MVEQIIVNIIIDVFKYLLIAISFFIIFNSTKYLHLAHAIIITVSPFLFYQFYVILSFNILLSFVFSVILSTILGVTMNQFVYKPISKGKPPNMVYLITSLGLYVVFQNFISLIWGDDTKSLTTGMNIERHQFIKAYFTDIQLIIVITGILVFLLISGFFKYSTIGLKMRAVSSNRELATIFGIECETIVTLSFAIGSLLAAITGILIGVDTNISPTMGFNYLLYGIVAMIIGGLGSRSGLIMGAIILSTAQHIGGYFLNQDWMQSIAYIILIMFLIWKPLGFSGKLLKKTEI